MAKASTSISKRAPKADASPWRRAAQPSAPSSSRAPARGRRAPPFRRPQRIGIDGSGGDQAGDSRPYQGNPVGRAQTGMGVVAGEPALDAEQARRTGQAGVRVGSDHPPKHQQECCGGGEPEGARKHRARLAHQRRRGRRQRSGPDRHRQGFGVSRDRALRDPIDKRPPPRLRRVGIIPR